MERRHVLRACTMAFVFCLLAPISAQQSVPQLPFESDPDFFKLPADLHFGEVSGVAVNSKAKRKDAGEKSDLALKSDGETAKHMPALAQTKPEAPSVVLLNPGTAGPKGNVRDPATTHESRAAPARTSGGETPRSDVGNSKPREERAGGSQNSMRDYHDLRDYMLRR